MAARVALSTRDRRALQLGAIVALPALLYVAAIKPYLRSVADAKTAIASQGDLLRRERALVASAPELPRAILVAQRTLTATDARLYGQRDPVAATAALSRDVTSALDDAGVALQRSEARDVVLRKDGLHELTIDVRAEGDLDGILSAVSQLEAGPKLIRVARLGIERSALVPAAANAPEALSLVATIHGYAR